MKQTVFRYGLYAAITIVILSAILVFILMPNTGYATAEVAGYLTMVLAMVFVFAGIRHYRDKVNDGFLSFGEGLKIGVLIVLIPAAFFGLFDIFYTEVLNPSWKEDYYNNYIRQIKETTPAAELADQLKKAEKQREMFSNPAMQFLLMAGTVFVIGFIVTIISTLTLRRPKPAAL